MHDVRRAASRAACTAGSNNATKMPMIAITTSSSTNVNPVRVVLSPGRCEIVPLFIVKSFMSLP
jgi:hypothetical protein